MLSVSEKIRLMARRRGLTMTGLAGKTGQTVQNLNNKLRRQNFTMAQLVQMADALGCKVDIVFIDEDTGDKV